MRTISSLTYTNVSLTVLILLVLTLLVKPLVSVPMAHAFEDTNPDLGRNDAQTRKMAALNPNADNAAAGREIAGAIREVASAIRESAKAQQGIAQAFVKLGQDAAPAK